MMDAVYDPSQTDLLYHRVVIEVLAPVNPFALTTNVPGAGGPGDRPGTAVFNLRQLLLTPRRPLLFTIGDDPAIVSPPIDQATGVRLPCDAANGPLPREFRVVEVWGDKTCMVLFRIECAIGYAPHYVVSNRWSVRSSIDAEGYTTRVTEGRATVRADLMRYVGQNIDEFRQWFIQPVGVGMVRKSVDVVVDESGNNLMYQVVDRQTSYNLGVNGPVRVDGNVTAGGEWPFRTWKDVILKAGEGFKAAGGGGLANFDGTEAVKWMVNAAPINKANALVRVTGPRESDRGALAAIAINVILDRFAPLRILGRVPLPSLYVSHLIGSDDAPAAEARAEALPMNLNAVRALLLGQPERLLNTSSDVGGYTRDQGANRPLPSRQNSRGSWTGALLVQTLTGDQGLPSLPPDPRVTVERGFLA
jgi:hypothetical protein